jgi:hypothetical protein
VSLHRSRLSQQSSPRLCGSRSSRLSLRCSGSNGISPSTPGPRCQRQQLRPPNANPVINRSQLLDRKDQSQPQPDVLAGCTAEQANARGRRSGLCCWAVTRSAQASQRKRHHPLLRIGDHQVVMVHGIGQAKLGRVPLRSSPMGLEGRALRPASSRSLGPRSLWERPGLGGPSSMIHRRRCASARSGWSSLSFPCKHRQWEILGTIELIAQSAKRDFSNQRVLRWCPHNPKGLEQEGALG